MPPDILYISRVSIERVMAQAKQLGWTSAAFDIATCCRCLAIISNITAFRNNGKQRFRQELIIPLSVILFAIKLSRVVPGYLWSSC